MQKTMQFFGEANRHLTLEDAEDFSSSKKDLPDIHKKGRES